MITRVSKMCGNPMFTLTNEGYNQAINGELPQELNEALNDFGIIVIENKETESMMFLVQEELKGNQKKIDANKNGKIDSEDFKLLRSRKKSR